MVAGLGCSVSGSLLSSRNEWPDGHLISVQNQFVLCGNCVYINLISFFKTNSDGMCGCVGVNFMTKMKLCGPEETV